MIAEPLDVDFYTTGRTPSAEEFAMISEHFKKQREWDHVGNPPLEKEYKTLLLQAIRFYCKIK